MLVSTPCLQIPAHYPRARAGQPHQGGFRGSVQSWLAVREAAEGRSARLLNHGIWAAACRIQGLRNDARNAPRATSWVRRPGAMLLFFISARSGLAMIDLYYWTTPNGHKVTIFLEEAGLKYNVIPINIGKGEQFKADFLAVAPNNRIPAIVDHAPTDGGKPISIFESGAILVYLA